MSIRVPLPRSLASWAAAGWLVGLAACGGGPVTKAPPPFRPQPVAVEEAPPPDREVRADCSPPQMGSGKPALTYGERSIPEARRLADQGLGELKAAESPGIDPGERERLITSAVELFIDALLADPYNVLATYNLAAAYARIERPQCAINQLERLIQMRDHPSKRAEVEQRLDRLLGRAKQPLDPDFNGMRGDPRFRTLIRQLCRGTDDPGCVFGR
jgi:hypothetical protein